jgi:hypothetical protein
VLTSGGFQQPVGQLELKAGSGPAFNLTVEGLHTYHVIVGSSAILVHNVCPIDDFAANITPQVLDHVFIPKRHNLGALVTKFGSEEAVIGKMLNGVRSSVPISGLFEIPVQIGGQIVVVRGSVVNGIIRISTAFTPR